MGDIDGAERIMDDPDYQDTLKKYMERKDENESNKDYM